MVPARLVTVMGSGETTATMVAVHRAMLERFPGRPPIAVPDTPHGFQEKADELTRRARHPAAGGAVEALLDVRARGRNDRRSEGADVIRRALRPLSVEVPGTLEGIIWRAPSG